MSGGWRGQEGDAKCETRRGSRGLGKDRLSAAGYRRECCSGSIPLPYLNIPVSSSPSSSIEATTNIGYNYTQYGVSPPRKRYRLCIGPILFKSCHLSLKTSRSISVTRVELDAGAGSRDRALRSLNMPISRYPVCYYPRHIQETEACSGTLA